ncbi:MAG: ACP S-malonyltransferase [Acidimicrobiales bacterium]
MPLAVMFPGQGAQHPAMGAPWREHTAWSVVDRAASALGRPAGELAGLLLDPDACFDRTEDAQLAVLLTSLMAWEATAATLEAPMVVAGHSLGQVTALIASGVLGFDEGIALAARRAGHTQAAAQRRPGEMVALLGASLEQAELACTAAPDSCWVANDNAPGQVVVAGTAEGVAAAGLRAAEIGVRRVTRLAVGGAFHTPLMAEAAKALAGDLREVPLADPSMPVVANDDATAHRDGEPWRTRLVDHLVRPVRWRQSVEAMVAMGATEFVEIGPGGILAGLARRIAPHLPVRSIGSPLLEVVSCR